MRMKKKKTLFWLLSYIFHNVKIKCNKSKFSGGQSYKISWFSKRNGLRILLEIFCLIDIFGAVFYSCRNVQRIHCSSPSSFTFHSLLVTIYRIYLSLLSSHSHLLRAGMKSKHTVTLLKSYIHSIRIIPKHKHSLPQVLLSQPPFGSNHKPVTFQVSQRKRAHRMDFKA